MVSKKTLNADNLAALGAARLSKLLIEISTDDAVLKRRLRLELAAEAGTGDVAREIRKRLITIGKARAFVDWTKNAALAADLDTQREMIVSKVAPSDPATALDLMWRFMALAESVYERCDDSNGRIGAVFRTACSDLSTIAAATRPDPAELADRAFEALWANGYGQFDHLIEGLAPTLGRTGLEHLKGRMIEYGSKPVSLAPDEDEVIGWGSGAGQIRRSDIERSRVESTVHVALTEIADALGDVDAFIAQYSPTARKAYQVAANIAQRLLSAGRAQEALTIIDDADARGHRSHSGDLAQARVDALDALGHAYEAQAFRWECFERTLDAGHLREYLKRLPDFEDVEAEERALAFAQDWQDLHATLHFLIGWPALELAAELVVSRRAELNGDLYELLTPAAEAFAARDPLAATVVLRAMIDFTLAEARSTRYRHAARHLRSCDQLDTQITDYGDVDPHEVYLDRLQDEHGRKSSFWKLLS